MSLSLSIRLKLALLAGVPVVGAAILSAQIASQAMGQVKLAKSLGSIESLVELSKRSTDLIHDLEREQTSLCLLTGYRVGTNETGDKTGEAALKGQREALNRTQFATSQTDARIQQLNEFLASRDASMLPKKLSKSLTQARHQVATLSNLRIQSETGVPRWEPLLDHYGRAIRLLTDTVAGLAELTNDGELLRTLNALVALLEFEASASAEHALLAHVLAVGDFPPGSYRKLVTVVTEQELYQDVFSTVATFEAKKLFDETMPASLTEPVLQMRKKVMSAVDDELTQPPEAWLSVGRTRLDSVAAFEQRLHADSSHFASLKLKQVNHDVALAGLLAGGIILFNLLFAGVIARGITRRISHLREVVARVGDGDLTVRADL